LEQKAHVQNEKSHTIIGAQNHLEQQANAQKINGNLLHKMKLFSTHGYRKALYAIFDGFPLN